MGQPAAETPVLSRCSTNVSHCHPHAHSLIIVSLGELALRTSVRRHHSTHCGQYGYAPVSPETDKGMAMSDVKLLSEPRNYAVVHLPGRAFPGVVFQGDSLDSLIREIEEAAAEQDTDERDACLAGVIERLTEVRKHYEAVLKREGMKLPYFKS